MFFLMALMGFVFGFEIVDWNKIVETPNINISFSIDKSIYGINSMKDYYEVSSQLKELADSTVILVRDDAISYDSVKRKYVRVKEKSLSQSYYLSEEEKFSNQPILGFCSGAIVSKNLVLTAGHCISDDNYSSVKVIFNWRIDSEGNFPRYFDEDDVYKIKRIVTRKHTGKGANNYEFINNYKDYALVELERDVVGRKPLEVDKERELSKGDYIFTIGYPAGLPVKITDPYDSVVYAKGKTIYKTNTDLLGGSSGGPVFDTKTNRIIGIVVTGEHEYVYNTKKEFLFQIRIDSNVSVGDVEFFKDSLPYIKTDLETSKNIINSFKNKGCDIKCEDEVCLVYVKKNTSFTNREIMIMNIIIKLAGREIVDKGRLITYQHDRDGSGILKILDEFSVYIP